MHKYFCSNSSVHDCDCASMSLRRGATQDGTSTGTATEHATQQPLKRARFAAELIDVNAFQVIMHDPNIWMHIMICLATSPSVRDNGIASASRVLNIRWRKMHRAVTRTMLDGLIEHSSDLDIHLNILDLKDVIVG